MLQSVYFLGPYKQLSSASFETHEIHTLNFKSGVYLLKFIPIFMAHTSVEYGGLQCSLLDRQRDGSPPRESEYLICGVMNANESR